MNAAHLHLIVLHFPIAGAFLALPLLALALWRRGEAGTTYAAAIVLVIAAAGALVAVETGEGAEEVVEPLAGFSEPDLHEHEERGELALWVSIAAGVLGLGAAGAAWSGRTRLTTVALGAALAADLGAAGVGGPRHDARVDRPAVDRVNYIRGP